VSFEDSQYHWLIKGVAGAIGNRFAPGVAQALSHLSLYRAFRQNFADLHKQLVLANQAFMFLVAGKRVVYPSWCNAFGAAIIAPCNTAGSSQELPH